MTEPSFYKAMQELFFTIRRSIYLLRYVKEDFYRIDHGFVNYYLLI